ncbi:hypothetical protein D7Y21_39940, partial [Corallococcus sp. AB045]
MDLSTQCHASLVDYVDVPKCGGDMDLPLTWVEAGGYKYDPDTAPREAGVCWTHGRARCFYLCVQPCATAWPGRVVMAVDVVSSLVNGAEVTVRPTTCREALPGYRRAADASGHGEAGGEAGVGARRESLRG